MTSEQESKLPVYARVELGRLRDRVTGLEFRLLDQKRVHAYNEGSNGGLYELDILRNDMRPLKEGRVRIPLDVLDGRHLDITTYPSLKDGTWRIQVHSAGSRTGLLDIRPEAANVVNIGVEPW